MLAQYALAFVNLLGTFLERPRSRKLPENDHLMIESRVIASCLMTWQYGVRARLLNLPGTFVVRPRSMKLLGTELLIALCPQGGGVYISAGTVNFQSCEIHNNTADAVRAWFSEPSWYFPRTPPIDETSRK